MAVKIQKSKKPEKPVHASGKVLSQELQTAVGIVTKSNPDGSKTEEHEEVGVVHGPGPFANVGVRAARTTNLGDYNSAKVEVSLFVPCPVNEQEINDTFVFCYGWVESKMEEVLTNMGQNKA